MSRLTVEERLARSVQPIVSVDPHDRRQHNQGKIEGCGTGFVCHRDHAGYYILTCCHVVETISAEKLRIAGQTPEVLACGNTVYDLALLRVQHLENCEILRLSEQESCSGDCRTLGYTWADERMSDLIARPLTVRLGEKAYRRDREGTLHAAGWDLEVLRESPFRDLKPGYSGAPVLDPDTGLVVGIITHREVDEGRTGGLSIAPAHLRRIHDRAGEMFEADHEHHHHDDPHWLVKTLDHRPQVATLRRQLAATAPTIAVVTGCPDDCPEFLADDVLLRNWPVREETAQRAIPLGAVTDLWSATECWERIHFWDSGNLPPDASPETVRRLGAHILRSRGQQCHVFRVSLAITGETGHLPRFARAAREFLDELRHHGITAVLLIVCQPDFRDPPWWWCLLRWYWRRRRLRHIAWLDDLRVLRPGDITDWHDDPRWKHQLPFVNRGMLRKELLALFNEATPEHRYRWISDHLMDSGLLARAGVRF